MKKNILKAGLVFAVIVFFDCAGQSVVFGKSSYTNPFNSKQDKTPGVLRKNFVQPAQVTLGPSVTGAAQNTDTCGNGNPVVIPSAGNVSTTIPAESPYASETGIFDSVNSPIDDAAMLQKTGDYSLAIVSDEHISQASWIFADFNAGGQSYTIPALTQKDGTTVQLFGSDWTQFKENPQDFALRLISLGAGNTFDVVLVDDGGREIRFSIGGDGGLLGANSPRNQTAIAGFDWITSKAPADFNWTNVTGLKVESTQAGWALVGDVKIVGFNDDYKIAMGVAGHDLQGEGWRERLDNYISYNGQKPSVGTYFTTIFEPIKESNDSGDHYSDIIARAKELIRLGEVPAVTLEFRSWAQMTQDQAKIDTERTQFNRLNKGGIGYDDFINNYVNQNKVLDAVNAGLLDPLLKNIAGQMGKLDSAVYLRLFHEPYSWFPWGIRSAEDIQKFKDAWVHVGQIFEKQGATNVKFVMTLDPSEQGGTAWSEVTAIPSRYLSVVELDGYTDPNLRQNANLSANELFTKKLTEINWQLQVTYPDPATRPTVAIGEFAFSGGDYFSKEQAYTWFANDLMHRAYNINRFSVLYTYQAGPRPSVDALNYSPPQEGYWSATWQPESPWYPNLMNELKNTVGLWDPSKDKKGHQAPHFIRYFQDYFRRFLDLWKNLPRIKR